MAVEMEQRPAFEEQQAQQPEQKGQRPQTGGGKPSFLHRPVRAARRLLLTAAALVVVGAVCFFAGNLAAKGREQASTTVSAVVLKAQLAAASELATVRYHYTNMGQFANTADFYGVKLPFTTKSFILTYDGVIKAGVDLSDVYVQSDASGVLVQLPAAKVLSHEIDEQSLEVFDEKTSIFNPFTVEDYNGFQADQKAVMEQKALDNGLLEEANAQAVDAVTRLLASVVPETVSLTVKSAG